MTITYPAVVWEGYIDNVGRYYRVVIVRRSAGYFPPEVVVERGHKDSMGVVGWICEDDGEWRSNAILMALDHLRKA